jgi:hypothetical protein
VGHVLLDEEAPGLADRLGQLQLEQRRRILAQVCRLASQTIDCLEPEDHALLGALSQDGALSGGQVAEAQRRAEAADDQYLTLQEEGAPESQWTCLFEKARLLTAISYGFRGDSADDTADAMYELSKTREDPSAIFDLVESMIAGGS